MPKQSPPTKKKQRFKPALQAESTGFVQGWVFKVKSFFSRVWRSQPKEKVPMESEPINMMNGLLVFPVVEFDPFVEVRGIGWNGRMTIGTGTVGFAVHNEDPFDHDCLPQIYLEGEVIRKNPFRLGNRLIAARLSERPGGFRVEVKTPLAGISRSENDVAIAEFSFRFGLRDPRELLRQQSNWQTKRGQQRLRDDVMQLVNSDVRTTLENKEIQVWSSGHIADVADEIFKSLDAKLKLWGLAVMRDFIAKRSYPERLDQIVLQLQSVETGLLELDERRQDMLVAKYKLGLSPVDLRNLSAKSKKDGIGSGLYDFARRSVAPFAAWLKLENAFDAADCLSKLYSGKFQEREIALSENAINSRFHHPMLGLGEWGGADLNLDRIAVPQLGEYFRTFSDRF